MKIILLLIIGFTNFSFGELTKNTNIISDSVTKLQWQDDESTITNLDWEAAISHCEALDLGQNFDWRLPNIRELQSIVDKGAINPAVNKTIFGDTTLGTYWSSSTDYVDGSGNKQYAWTINFFSGNNDASDKSNNKDVRCVRDSE